MEESYFAPVVIGEAAEQEAVDDDVGTGELPEAVLVADDLYAPDDSESFGRLETLISSWNKLEAHENLIASTWQEVLWPEYHPGNSSQVHTISIVAMINEKFRLVPFNWSTITQKDTFSLFFEQVMKITVSKENDYASKTMCITFLVNCLASLDIQSVRSEIMKFCNIGMWSALSSRNLDELVGESSQYQEWARGWTKTEKRYDLAKGISKSKLKFQRGFVSLMIQQFYETLESLGDSKEPSLDNVRFMERFLEFTTDLLSQLPTRRYFNVLFKDHLFVPICNQSIYLKKNPRSMFASLLKTLRFYATFEIDDSTGMALTRDEVVSSRHDRIQKLQKLCFIKHQDTMESFIFSFPVNMETPELIRNIFLGYSDEVIVTFCQEVGIRTEEFTRKVRYSRDFCIEAIVWLLQKHPSQIDQVNHESLYPTEKMMFNDDYMPSNQTFSNAHCLSIPKLNLQFLTLHDYLLRNFKLYKLEAGFAIRQDIEETCLRLRPRYNLDSSNAADSTIFDGWSRNAVPLNQMQIEKVGEPRLTDSTPSYVTADLCYSIDKFNRQNQAEWDDIRRNDTLFLISLQILPSADVYEGIPQSGEAFVKRFGIKHIRGCQVDSFLGDDGLPVNDFISANIPNADGEARIETLERTVRVLLDPNQYSIDSTQKKEYDIYGTMNVLLRRPRSENTFKSILETIRDLMQTELGVPEWVNDVILGYGKRDGAHYTQLPNPDVSIDFRDTFIDWNHLQSSFPGKKTLEPPFTLQFPRSDFACFADEQNGEDSHKRKAQDDAIVVRRSANVPTDNFKHNTIPFTPTQVEAIRAGSSQGLSLIVGPPGTGKTDVAVQIIANTYHNYPDQHILVITRSNQALNHIFEKINKLDINQRHLLRLGHGVEDLKDGNGDSGGDGSSRWGKLGRINTFLELRLEFLEKVNDISKSLNIVGAHGENCANASYFYSAQIVPRWTAFVKLQRKGTADSLMEAFPFAAYFTDSAQTFQGQTKEKIIDIASEYYTSLGKLFLELQDFRPFELLRSNRDRANYLLVKEARIICMTSTHASLKRRELVRLGFRYDTVIMEESGQLLEIESFIPLLLQPTDQGSRLKRICMIGDHHQLAPVIKNNGVRMYGNMQQSLFSRFIRLGVPSIQLDFQARCRPTIADLYRWNYSNLQDIEFEEFKRPNSGFTNEYQFVNVPDYQGKGETMPRAYFTQNLGEAEFVVAVFKYPASKIVILTTYNGQRELIQDVLNNRCGQKYGRPGLSTVDKYQGQQCDFVLLSLVRTKAVGHLRDVRRLIVALSRARLGLYIFGRWDLFKKCPELAPAFAKLAIKPHEHLSLVRNEMYGSTSQKRMPVLVKGTVAMLDFVVSLEK